MPDFDPWLMWGSAQPIPRLALDLTAGGVKDTLPQTLQLARINYKRPESWHFFFVLLIRQLSATTQLDVTFNLIFGVGRSSIEIPAFEHFIFKAGVSAITTPTRVYSQSVLGPVRDNTASTPTRSEIREITAQDIQCNASVDFTAPSGGTGVVTATCEVHAYFAPATHNRPDWFNGKFSGNEIGGH